MVGKTEVHGARADRERQLPPFAALRAFEALIRLGGVRKAAQALGVHHSVVSRQVSQLEAWLGAPLLKRSAKGLALTEEGSRFHARISAAIGEIAQATHDVLDGEAQRPLRLWCSQALSIEWLAKQIVEFERRHPDMPIELRPSDVPANLHHFEADANIFKHFGDDLHETERGLKGHVLAQLPLLVVASPDLAAELSWVRSVADLLNAPLLHGAHTGDWRMWLIANGVDPPDPLPGELCWHPHMALESARLGRGLALGSRFFFQRDLEHGALVELSVEGATTRAIGGYKFVARDDRWSTPRIATLREFLGERMKSMEGPPTAVA
ncbi:LysR substrate-binding domain-containing protein [Phenylobacterium sp. LjRoot219]|uniref:LysR substrate-binding domain-containing protein n=1 Tax=Phenylobacterium sp. LjRoot219 TaxID=3342283 RepID=UPI003ECD390E